MDLTERLPIFPMNQPVWIAAAALSLKHAAQVRNWEYSFRSNAASPFWRVI